MLQYMYVELCAGKWLPLTAVLAATIGHIVLQRRFFVSEQNSLGYEDELGTKYWAERLYK
jgi:hypothetical protein